MNWFYVQNGAQAGPVEDAALDELVRTGAIVPDTLIWREGMANWEPYRNARATTAPPAFPNLAGPATAAAAPAAAAIPTAGGRQCAQCGLIFPESEVVPLAGAYVCANCKPVALQRMREGTWMTGARRYAGFWIRFVALVIDGLILAIGQYAILIPLGLGLGVGVLGTDPDPSNLGALMGVIALSVLVGVGIQLAYQVYFLTKFGATPGKLLLGLKVIRSDGSGISPGRAVGRVFSHFLSAIILYIGYIMAGFDNEKRALHDHICDTRVIYKS